MGKVDGRDEPEGIGLMASYTYMKSFAIALCGAGGACWGRQWGNLTNVQCKHIQNFHNDSSLNSEYINKNEKRKILFL
jgi:hypothetical protein